MEAPLAARTRTYYTGNIGLATADGLSGWDGVYGFAGPALRGDYQPLSGSALVLGNPEDAPTQQYSYYVMPNELMESFIDTVPTGDGGTRFCHMNRGRPRPSQRYASGRAASVTPTRADHLRPGGRGKSGQRRPPRSAERGRR
ncbi:glycoside hydrolase family 68 protein [Streptomyces sp. IMTB 2501]|uniref:glycoside hydrolase family 68 protein n=1 Tax=Streptomyces sp. IMTB 2501 TaxID=1776340 RepID=UPI00273D73EA|nr:glycoside hydrolase family 68 protein [Streptomyces sp. IMTB 2501]